MARGRSAGSVWIDIIADNAKFVKALTDSRSKMMRFARHVRRSAREVARSFRNIGLAVAGIGTAFIAASAKMAGYSAKLVETSRATGLAVKELEALRTLFEGDGVAIERTDKALQALNNRLGQAARGFGQGARALEDMGVRVRTTGGEVRSTSAIFTEVAGKIAGMKSEAEATSLLFDLMGNDAKILAPIIRRYGNQILQVARHANRFNTVTEEQHETNKELDQSFLELKKNVADFANRVLSAYSSELQTAIDKFGRWLTDIKNGKKPLEELGNSLAAIGRSISTIATGLAGVAIGRQAGATIGVLGALAGIQVGGTTLGPGGAIIGGALGGLGGIGLGFMAPELIESYLFSSLSGRSLGQTLEDLRVKQDRLLQLDQMNESDVAEYNQIIKQMQAVRAAIGRRNLYQKRLIRDSDYVTYPQPSDPNEGLTWKQIFAKEGGIANAWTERRSRRELLEYRAPYELGATSTVRNPRARRDRGDLLDYRNPFFYPGAQLGGMNPSLASHYSHVSAMVDLLGATRARSRPSGRGVYFGADARRAIDSILTPTPWPMDDNSPYTRWSNRRRVPIGGLSPMIDNPPLSMQWFAKRGRGRDPMKQATELARMLKGIQSIGSGMTSSGPGLSAERFADFVLTTVVDDAQEFIANLLDKRRQMWKETGITEGSHLVSMERLMRALPMDDDSPFSINRIVNMAGRAFAGRLYAGTTDWQNMSNQYPDQSHLRGRIYGPDTDWQRMSDNLKSAKEMQKEMEDFKSITQEAHGAFTSFGDSLIDIAMSGKESWLAFREVIKGLGRDLVNIGLRRLITNPIANSLFGTEDEPGGLLGGGFDWLTDNPLFGGGASAKGIDFAGIGASASLGGRGGVTIVNNIKSTDGPGVRAALAKATPGIINAAQSQISDNASRFGTTRQMIRGAA